MNNTEIKETVREMLKMSQAQLNYARARALYETIKIKVEAEKKLIPESDLTIADNWIPYSDIETKYDYWKVFDTKIKAERELIEWAKIILKTHKPADFIRIKVVFDKWDANEIYSEDLRQQFIDLCFKLDATTIK
jgi:hypothetical protein